MFHQVSGWFFILMTHSIIYPPAGEPILTEDSQDILTEDSQNILTEN